MSRTVSVFFLFLTAMLLTVAGCSKTADEAPAKPTTEAAAPESVAADDRPNIVIVLLDDTGYSDLGAFGSEIATPNIDAIAANGIQFTNFHAAAACTPTRGMLLTGVDNHLVGMGNMIEIMADNQFDQPGYEGFMGYNVVTLPTLLKEAGYNTYMAGKWHLGKTKKSIPAARGFERSVSLMESGADNFEKKSYLPLYDTVHFYEDFEEIDLPEDFFSTDYYTDRLIEYIGKDRAGKKPFFAYLSLQAQHYPLQAPQKYIDKYDGKYNAGWDEIRAQRYARQVEMGVMPAGLTLPPIAAAPTWDSLSDEDQRMYAKRMAVYAGMLDNVDENIGRLQDYLTEIGEAENTIFVILSDNGADNNEQDKVFPEWYAENFDLSFERMGLDGSYVNYGPGWAGASGSPLTLFKGAASEGGLRVPLIISGPAGIGRGTITDAFGFVTDIAPTLLEVASAAPAAENRGGKKVHPIDGKSMLSLLRGEQDFVHGPGEVVAYEMAGSVAVFRDGYKLTRNNPPFGNRQWRLYRSNEDPTEVNNLADDKPEIVAQLIAEYDRFSREVGLIEVPDDYHVMNQLQKNVARNQIDEVLDKVPLAD
jgi:arylsulfatase A-like enzyme